MRHPLSPAIDSCGRITKASRISALIFVLIIPSWAMVLGIVLLCLGRVSALDLWILLGSYLATGFGVTVGYHRLFTHRSFETSRLVRYLLSILGATAAEGAPIIWAAQHRQHHSASDLPGDPHSPVVERGAGVMGWLRAFWHSHYGHVFGQVALIDPERFAPDLARERFLVWMERWAALFVVLGLAIPALVGGLVSHSWLGAATGFLWGGLIRLFLITHATGAVNSICHMIGSRPFDTGDQSRNVWWLLLPTLGESWHAGHHAFPTSARHGLRWWELDLSWILIWCLEKTGLVRNVIKVSPERVKEKQLL